MTNAFYVSYVFMWLLVCVLTVLVLLMYRHFGLMSLETVAGVERDGLQVGEPAPEIQGVAADGREVTMPAAGRFIVFATPHCAPCAEVIPAIADLGAKSAATGLEVAVVVPGPTSMVKELVEGYELSVPPIAEDGTGVSEKYRVRVTPFAFVVDGDGRIRAKGLCSDPIRLRRILIAGDAPSAAEVVAEFARVSDLQPASPESRGVFAS